MISCRSHPILHESYILDTRFSIAPMMDWTDRHCRFFHRLMTRRARLYTEMLTTGAIIHGDRERLLGFDASEHPVALQLGGARARAAGTPPKKGGGFCHHQKKPQFGFPSRPGEGGPLAAWPL